MNSRKRMSFLLHPLDTAQLLKFEWCGIESTRVDSCRINPGKARKKPIHAKQTRRCGINKGGDKKRQANRGIGTSMEKYGIGGGGTIKSVRKIGFKNVGRGELLLKNSSSLILSY